MKKPFLNSGGNGGKQILGLVLLLAAGVLGAEAEKTVPTVEKRGVLVCLPEEMHRVYEADLPAKHAHVLGFRTKEGIYYTLLRTKLSEALFADPRLKKKTLLLKGRVFPGSQVLDVTVIYSVKKGMVHDLYYWCDICTIKSVVPEQCMCCQLPVELKEDPLARE